MANLVTVLAMDISVELLDPVKDLYQDMVALHPQNYENVYQTIKYS